MRTSTQWNLIFAVVILVALTGCGAASSDVTGDGPSSAADTSESEAQSPPQELVIAVGGEPDDGFDPTLGWGRYGSPLFHSTLLRLDSDLEIQPDLATEYDLGDDRTTWTVQLRDDATFSNGEPVTVSDVVYTFSTAAESGGLVDLAIMERAEAVADDTVAFHLSSPDSTFVNQLATIGIVPASLHNEEYGRNPVGSGPFILDRWDEGQQLIVVRNPEYYGEQPAFERVIFRFMGEDAVLAGARAGELDLATVPASLVSGEIEGMTLRSIQSVDNRGIVFPIPESGETSPEGEPIGNDVTSDLAIRQAFNLVVDRQALVDGILNGYGRPAYGPVDGLPWYESSSEIHDGDPVRAREILEDAGWIDEDGDGVVEKNGVPASFTVVYPASDSVRQGLAVATAEMAREIGLDVSVDGLSWDEIETVMHSTPVVLGWGNHDPSEMYNLYHSALAGNEYFNNGYYRSEHVDTELDAALAAPTLEEANLHWRSAQLDGENGFTAPADAAWAWLVNLDHLYYTNECLDLGDVQVEPHGHGYPITAGITNWTWSC